MAENDVWILGAAMTKFGRYTDKDVIDLASDASMAALNDGGVTIHDMDVMGAGNLMEAASGIGQRIQKQIGQTGIPVYNVANACATGATAIRCVNMAIKAGEADMGLGGEFAFFEGVHDFRIAGVERKWNTTCVGCIAPAAAPSAKRGGTRHCARHDAYRFSTI